MPTNKQRREATRRHLERQLENRRIREAKRRRQTLVISVVLTVVLIAGIVVAVVALSSGDDKKKNTASSKNPTSSTSQSVSPSTSASVAPLGTPKACAKPSDKKSLTYDGVTITNGTDLSKAPDVTSKATKDPTALACQDVVVGKGAAADPTADVTVQYTGLIYKTSKKFEASWDSGSPANFSLTGVVAGFTQGIGGIGKVAPMRVGGRRIMILPASLAYGTTGNGAIPPNTPLVFIVDLVKVGSATASGSASASG